MNHPNQIVYVMVSDANPQRHYVGLTSDVQRRLAVHNSGGSQHTAPYRPWRLIVALEFGRLASAVAFERYLKTGSGRAVANATSCEKHPHADASRCRREIPSRSGSRVTDVSPIGSALALTLCVGDGCNAR